MSRETFTERARRAQLVEVTVERIAEHGVARCSLARIAEAAGITKGAVLYHFATRDALVRAAYEHVLGVLTDAVGAAVDAAPGPAAAVDAYVTTMIEHLAAHPRHVRLLADTLGDPASGVDDRDDRPARWGPLAGLVDAARDAGEYRHEVDARRLAVLLGGAIDGVVAERLADPGFDTTAAADDLRALLTLNARNQGSTPIGRSPQ